MGSQEEVRVKRWEPSNSDVDLEADIGPWSDIGPWTDIDPWPDNGPWAAVKVEDRWAQIPTLARRRTLVHGQTLDHGLT